MKTVWAFSQETEALRLLHVAHQISTGFFKINHFLPLPYPLKGGGDNLVSFPDLPYLTIPRFWEKSARINIELFPQIKIYVPKDLIFQTQKLLTGAKIPIPNYKSIQESWDKVQNQVLATIYKIVPKAKKIKSITIWPTSFGTTCSFNLCDKTSHNIVIWLREDQGVGAIIEAILTSLTRKDVQNDLGGLWAESEIIVDWLLSSSQLSKYIKNPPKTIKSTRGLQNAVLLKKSEEFLRKIGAPGVSPKNVKIDNLSFIQGKLFNLLASRSPNLVTIDEIADLLFAGDPDKFSLYAIAKHVQRLRDRLEKSGISGSFIQTKRGEGYLLVN